MDVVQRHSYAVCYEASMIKWLTSQSKTKIFHFIWRRNAGWLPTLHCGKKSMLFFFWPHAKPRLTPGMDPTLLCSVWMCGSTTIQLILVPKSKLSETVRKSTFSSCINCIRWRHLMLLHCIIKAKLQGSRWPTDAISPPKLVGKSVILTSNENKYWGLQSRAFFKSRELIMVMAISVKCLLLCKGVDYGLYN